MSATSPDQIDVDVDTTDSEIKPSRQLTYGKITSDALWTNNAGLVQLLGLCPLLAVTGNVINGLGLGIATIITLTCSNLIIAFTRNWVRKEIRIPYYVLIISSIVTIIDLSMNAITPELHSVLGIFIPLIVTNCLIIGRAEAFASKNDIPRAALDGFMMGLGFTLVLVALGAIREILGSGTLLSGASLLFGSMAENWTLTLFDDYKGFLLAILPPGAFLVMGLLIAVKNVIDKKIKAN
ncbi:UNVERIFIED_CONTAM: hypothetical protein GTU68_019520 [Idotea baltica]|nr:hypothetical protein [Idotea baltica]